jgi:hypothetical protein
MTPKLIGRNTGERVYPDRKPQPAIVTQCGRKFIYAHQVPPEQRQFVVGEKVWIRKNTNVHRSDPWRYQLYQVTLVENKYMAEHGHPNKPQTWFGNCRRIVIEM